MSRKEDGQALEYIALSHDGDEDGALLPTGSEDEVEDTKKGASKIGVFFNICNTSIGASVLALPFAFEAMGVIQGVILLVVFAIISLVGVDLLPLTAEAVGAKSYENMMAAGFGPILMKVFQVTVIFYSVGIAIGFVVIIEDLIPPIISSWAGQPFPNDFWYLKPWFIGLIITTVIMFPLASLRRIDSLKTASMFAITAVIYFTVLVVVESAFDLDQWQEAGIVEHTNTPLLESVVWWNWSYDVFLGIPIMAFAFGGHSQAIFLFSELHPKDRSISTWNYISIAAYIFLGIIFLIVAILSYLRFLPGEDGNVLQQMLAKDPSNAAVQVAAIAMSINVILAFPLFTYPVRYSIDRLLFGRWVSIYDPTPLGRVWHSTVRYWLITFGIVYTCYVVASVVGKIDLVFGLVGAIGGTAIKFIFPVMAYFKLGPKYREKFTSYNPKLPWYHIAGCVFLLVMSTGAGIVSAVLVLLRAYNNFVANGTVDESALY